MKTNVTLYPFLDIIRNFFERSDYEEILQKYKKVGVKIFLGENSLIIYKNNHKYIVTITNHDQRYFWHLEPYHNSYYETFADIEKGNLDIVLFAIKENEELYC